MFSLIFCTPEIKKREENAGPEKGRAKPIPLVSWRELRADSVYYCLPKMWGPPAHSDSGHLVAYQGTFFSYWTER